MRFCCAVLIAAVTVNCLVTAINGKTATNTAIEPFNMLLPPLEDKPHDAVKTTKTPAIAVATTTRKATTTTTARTTTAKPLTNNVNNALPELSIEALLPPLFDAKIEKAEDEHKQQQTHPAKTTTPPAPTTTTITTTARATTTTTGTTPHTQKNELSKTTKKSYYQQQTQHLKDLHSADATPIQSHTKASKDKQQQKPFGANKHVAETKTSTKQVPQHVISNIEQLASQHVAVQVAQRQRQAAGDNQYNVNGLDLYLGTTTPRPLKYGLPTITPFPHRLRR